MEDYKRRGSPIRRKSNECMRGIVTIIVSLVIGFFIGVSFPAFSPPKLKLVPSIDTYLGDQDSGQRLPPAIIASESDFYPRRLYGLPSEDLTFKPKYLVTFTVGYNQKDNIDKAIKKFSGNFTILLFHYDGLTTEWDEFEWSKQAIHISVPKQTKWWYAKRFLHPDIVAPYDYIFIWDEDLGVENFDAEEYIKLVKKHKLEISQPGLDPDSKGLTWQMTKRREDLEVHIIIKRQDAWRCVWYLIQNDLVHGWGLDFALRKCIEPAYERIGVVDAQWIVHQGVPSLGNQLLHLYPHPLHIA
nr:hypothetical protein CTI12_AA049340 [Tanacetum cinerariifolium]